MIAHHPAATRHFTAWKNGGGETAEIVCQPEGAGFDDFQWRISTARVATSGPFSVFPGVARSLTVLESGPMVLRIDGGPEIVATPDTGPIAFRGDVSCQADLIGPPVLDLNVMTRSPFGAEVRCASAPLPAGLPAPEARYLFALSDLPMLAMHHLDLARISPQSVLPALDRGAALIIDIRRL